MVVEFVRMSLRQHRYFRRLIKIGLNTVFMLTMIIEFTVLTVHQHIMGIRKFQSCLTLTNHSIRANFGRNIETAIKI